MLKTKLRCPHCYASSDASLEKNLESISSCTNCQVDLMLRGKWIGTGHGIMMLLVEKYGLEIVKLTYEKLQFQKL